MPFKKSVGSKAFVTDLDGPIGNCQNIADSLGIGEIYRKCKNNPSLLQEELNGLTEEFFTIAKKLSEGFELYPDVGITLKTLKLKGYDNFVCTDNPIFGIGKNGESFKRRLIENVQDDELSDDIPYLDELHVTLIPEVIDDKLYLRSNKSKKSYVREKFVEYGSGILLVDDENDLEAAKEANNLKGEYKITILKFGENCKELEKYCDATIKSFSEVLKYA